MTGILEPRGGVPQGFKLLCSGYVYRFAPETPFFWGKLTGPEAFSELPGAFGLCQETPYKRPCATFVCLVGRRTNTVKPQLSTGTFDSQYAELKNNDYENKISTHNN